MIRKFIAAFVLIFFFASTTAFAAECTIDWSRGIIRTTGIGMGPENWDKRNNAYKTQARQAARLDALRNLYEIISGLNITPESTLRDFELEYDQISLSQTMQKNFSNNFGIKQIEVTFDEDLCTVTLELPIFKGKGSLCDMVLIPFKKESKLSFAKPSTKVSLGKTEYTGLIVDCRGMFINPVVLPVIKDDMGRLLYGYKFLDNERIIANGIVTYSGDISAQLSLSRAGSNPLVVRAIALVDHSATPVVTVMDADKILAATQRDRFLDNCAVVFVR